MVCFQAHTTIIIMAAQNRNSGTNQGNCILLLQRLMMLSKGHLKTDLTKADNAMRKISLHYVREFSFCKQFK